MNQSRSPISSLNSRRIGCLIVLFLFAVNLFFYSGRFHSIDEMALLSTTESIVKWQRADINALAWEQWLLRGPDAQGSFNATGDLYAKKAPLVAWLAVPIYALAGWASSGQVQASMLINALIVALTGGVVFRLARRLGYSASIAAWAALLFGLGTSALVYARHLFSEPLAGLGFLLAAEAVWRARNEESAGGRALALGGAGLGAAVLANPVNLVFAPIFFAALLIPSASRHARAVGHLLWPLALSLALMAIWNAARFGNPFTSGYHLGSGEGFTSPLWVSLPALLFSPARGLVWFVPASLLALIGLIPFFKRHAQLAALSLALILGHVLVFSAWWMWWSGWGWGPRFLVPIMPFLALMALPIFNTQYPIPKGFGIGYWVLVALIFAASISVQVLGATVGFDEYENVMTQNYLRGDPEGDLYPYGLNIMWDWKLSPLIGHTQLLQVGNTDLAWLPRGQVDWLMLVPLVLLIAIIGMGLVRRQGTENIYLFLCIAAVMLVVWRAGIHPLRATYGLDPVEGRAALDSVMSRAQPGDGVLLTRHLTPAELDRLPHFPRVYGIPDDSLFGAEWNADLERLIENAQVRHKRLWLIVQSEQDSFAAQTAAYLKPHMQRVEQSVIGNYVVVLLERR